MEIERRICFMLYPREQVRYLTSSGVTRDGILEASNNKVIYVKIIKKILWISKNSMYLRKFSKRNNNDKLLSKYKNFFIN